MEYYLNVTRAWEGGLCGWNSYTHKFMYFYDLSQIQVKREASLSGDSNTAVLFFVLEWKESLWHRLSHLVG